MTAPLIKQARRAVKALGYADSFILWQGPSAFDGRPIVVLATGKYKRSGNEKTGPMLQVHFFPRDESIAQARRSGADRAVCGSCKFAGGKGCYVTPQGETSAWKIFRDGRSRPPLPGELDSESVRLGSWGDPASAPYEVTRRLAELGRMHTGYTHAWESCDVRFQRQVMASVDTLDEAKSAQAKGYRTFRTIGDGETFEPNEIECPADTNGTTCNACGLCNGSKGPHDKRKNIAIRIHGPAVNKAQESKTLVSIGGLKR